MSSETTITLTGDAEKVASILLEQRDAARDEADRLRAQVAAKDAQIAALLRVKEAAQRDVAFPYFVCGLEKAISDYEQEFPDGP